ncbi:MAG: hypothetical protein RBR35_14060 [Salinivirgaceae bacterium]|nr:hypothetical protein [Salinivirgaceae bacterium]
MKTELRTTILLWGCLALCYPALCDSTGELHKEITRIESDDKAVTAFIERLSKQDLFDLCNQHGSAVDNSPVGDGGMLIEMVLMELKRRSELSFADLLHCAGVESYSVYWRKMALRYSSGKEGFINQKDVDHKEALAFYATIITNSAAPESLRAEACLSSARVLREGYYVAVSGSIDCDKSRYRQQLKREDTPELIKQDRISEIFIDLILALAVDETTPIILKDQSIPRAFQDVISVRGQKTPRLAQIQVLVDECLKSANEDRRRAYKKVSIAIIQATTPFNPKAPVAF